MSLNHREDIIPTNGFSCNCLNLLSTDQLNKKYLEVFKESRVHFNEEPIKQEEFLRCLV